MTRHRTPRYRPRRTVAYHVVRANGDFLASTDHVPWQWSSRNALVFLSKAEARAVVRKMYGSSGVRVVRA